MCCRTSHNGRHRIAMADKSSSPCPWSAEHCHGNSPWTTVHHQTSNPKSIQASEEFEQLGRYPGTIKLFPLRPMLDTSWPHAIHQWLSWGRTTIDGSRNWKMSLHTVQSADKCQVRNLKIEVIRRRGPDVRWRTSFWLPGNHPCDWHGHLDELLQGRHRWAELFMPTLQTSK
jgi:hypothetical protein